MLDTRFDQAVENAPNNKDLGQAVVIHENTAYVGGPFLGIKPTDSGKVTDRSFLVALDRDTGKPIDTFLPDLDGEVFDMAVSADGSRLIIGGAFTSVDGNTDYAGLASLDPATGRLQTDWMASISYVAGVTNKPSVRDVELVGDEIYVAGNFHRITDRNGTRHARTRVARLRVASGVPVNWMPTVQGGKVNIIRLSKDGTRAYIGGRFKVVNGEAAPAGSATATPT